MKKFLLSVLLINLSGLVFSMQAQNIHHWETLIHEWESFRYFTEDVGANSGWQSIEYSDLNWNLGEGGFGYGDDDEQTIIEPTPTLYLRKKFVIENDNNIVNALLHIDYDDAFVAYLNGVEIARNNIGTAGIEPAYGTWSDEEQEAKMYLGMQPDQYLLDKEVIKEGMNILAVQIHNHTPSSSDMSARIYLSIGVSTDFYTYAEVPDYLDFPVGNNSSNIPLLLINTNGKQIKDDVRIVADMGIVDNGPGERNHTKDPYNGYNGKISIELRGSSSQMFPKKGYGFETQELDGSNKQASLLGMPEENDWVLHNPYSDKSLMRNVLSYYLSRRMGNYAPRTRFCELYINGNYKGVYVLVEKIKRDKNRVDIAELLPEDIEGDELTGGYILKVDKFTGSQGGSWVSPYPPHENPWGQVHIQYHDPKLIELMPEQAEYIQQYFTLFEQNLKSNAFKDSINGYHQFIKPDSFIDFLLVNEIAKNIDGYRLSTFFYKEKESDGGKIVMGPVWDFNLTYGNADYCEGLLTSDWQYASQETCAASIPFWWDRLLKDAAFKNRLKCRWEFFRESFAHTDSLMNYIDSLVLYLDESQKRNFEQWPILGEYVWPNAYIGKTYQDEIDFLKEWLTGRLEWIDENLPGFCDEPIVITDTGFDPIKDKSYQAKPDFYFYVYPNPVSGLDKQLQIYFSLARADKIQWTLYNELGQEISRYDSEGHSYERGEHTKTCTLPIGLPKGLYFLKGQGEKIGIYSNAILVMDE